MKKVYVITNKTKDSQLEVTAKVCELLHKKNIQCLAEVYGEPLPEDVDCILALGGDGTLIGVAREYYLKELPILGVNIGTLGYLAEVEPANLDEAFERLVNGTFTVEQRMMLKGTVNDKETDVALNDIVISRSGSLHLLSFKIYVNGQLLNTYQADGAIISTPTGSTAYNLSAGGPIVEPTASMIVITPICSHALNTGSIVLSADDEIVLEVGSRRDGGEEDAILSYDGERNIPLHTGDRVVISKAKETTRFIKLNEMSFLERLHKKMKGN